MWVTVEVLLKVPGFRKIEQKCLSKPYFLRLPAGHGVFAPLGRWRQAGEFKVILS